MKVSLSYPETKIKYLILRDGIHFTAHVFMGSTQNLWIIQDIANLSGIQTSAHIQKEDEWLEIEDNDEYWEWNSFESQARLINSLQNKIKIFKAQ